MTITLQRDPVDGPALHGVLTLDDGTRLGVTLENADRRIPAGRYRLTLYYSLKNRRIVPLLDKVPGRSYLEMHPANFWTELEGCIAPGVERDAMAIRHSVAAFEVLMKVLRPQLKACPTDTWIDVKDAAIAA